MRVVQVFCLLALIGCVDATPEDGVAKTAVAKVSKKALFDCRQQCWDDVPVDACRTERDTCLLTAATDGDKGTCRRQSRACRRVRRECLQGCKVDGVAHVDALTLDQ